MKGVFVDTNGFKYFIVVPALVGLLMITWAVPLY